MSKERTDSRIDVLGNNQGIFDPQFPMLFSSVPQQTMHSSRKFPKQKKTIKQERKF